MFEIFRNSEKEEILGDKSVLCWIGCLKCKFKSAVGCMSLEFTAGNISLSCVESMGRGPRPHPWDVSTFRGQAEEGLGAEREKEWPVRWEESQQGVRKARGKSVSLREGLPGLESAERSPLDLAKWVVGDQNDWL